MFVVADFGDGADPAAVLFERKGSSGNYPPSRAQGQALAPTISARTKGGGGLGTDFDLDVGVIAQCAGDGGGVSATVSSKWAKGSGGPAGDEHYNLVAAFAENTRAELRLEGGDGQRVGALSTGGGKPGQGVPTIAFQERGRADGRNVEWQDDLAYSLNAPNGGGRRQELNIATAPIAWSIMPQNSGNDFKAREVEVAQPLMAGGPVGGNQGGDYIQQAWQVRRLTPTECHRLQGLPDDHCAIAYRGKPAADGPMYKSLGNSWARPNGAWIIARLAERLGT